MEILSFFPSADIFSQLFFLTPEYIENELMDRAAAGVFDPRIGEAPTTLFIYLFVWDRCVRYLVFIFVAGVSCAWFSFL